MGCRGGGANLDKRNLFDKRNVVVESMGCRGGGNFDKRKTGRVADDSMGCTGGFDKRNVFS